MKFKRFRACFQYSVLLLSMISIGMSVALAADVQSEFPTSVHRAEGKPWTKMRAGSFEPTAYSAMVQCERAARQSRTDSLTKAHCRKFEFMLSYGQCKTVWVPDGVVHDFMSGVANGQPFVISRFGKKHGHDTVAKLCDLGDGVQGYFYTGTSKHCNNAAFVLLPPKVKEAGPLMYLPPNIMHHTGAINDNPMQVLSAPLLLNNCCNSCNQNNFVIPGSIMIGGQSDLKSTGRSVVDW